MTDCPIPHQSGIDSIQPYQPGRPIEEIQRLYGIHDVIKLASNENPLGASPKAVEAMNRALKQINRYPDGDCYALRQALAQHHHLPMEQIRVSNGADGLIRETCMAYLDENCDVIVSRSSFPIYDKYVLAMRARLIKTPLKNFGLDLFAMSNSINNRTRIIFVCNPNNPTGTIIHRNELDAFLTDVPQHILVVLDEAYYEFVDSQYFPNSIRYVLSGSPNIIILRTFSKIYGIAGIRLGYGMGHQAIFHSIDRVREAFGVNLLAQAAGIAALEDEEFVKASVEDNKNGRKYLYQEFDRLDIAYIPSHTNFILAELGPKAQVIIEKMTQKGIILRPCAQYDLPTYSRITIGSQSENQRLIRALEEVIQTIRGA